MAYTIYNNDGSVLLTLADGITDSITTSLTLVGRNVNSYGQTYNNNLIKLLGHFAGPNEPTSPIVGQLWYNTAEGRVKVYDLNQIFRPITSTLESEGIPTDLVPNDFWFDTKNQQLYYAQSGFVAPTLIAPRDSAIFGETGWVTESVQDKDTLGYHDVTKLYNAGQMVGVLSTTSFTLAVSTAGFTTIGVGLNLNPTIPGMKFIGTATSADSVSGINVSSFIRNDLDQTTRGALTIANNNGLLIQNSLLNQMVLNISTDSRHAAILYGSSGYPMKLQVTTPSQGITTALYLQSANSYVGLWTESPEYPLDILGDTRIQGNLYIVGTLTNITSVDLKVTDKNIELATGQVTPSDSYATDGGITLVGDTNHTLLWKNDGTGWNSNDHFNLTNSSSTYKINGTTVITKTGLGIAITSATGLTSVGTLTNLTVGNIFMYGSTITSTGNLVLDPTGVVSLNSGTIINLADPVNGQDAATKQYVLNQVNLKNNLFACSLSLDLTYIPPSYPTADDYVQSILDQMFPITNTGTDIVFDLPIGSRANVLAGTTAIPISTSTVDFNVGGVEVVTNVDFFSQTLTTTPVIPADPAYIVGTIPDQSVTPVTTYTVQTWRVEGTIGNSYWARTA